MARELLEKPDGSKSLIHRAVKGEPDKITPKIVYDAAKAGDAAALEINEVVCRHLAVAVSGSISIFNPELIVLGGGVMQAGDIIMNRVREYLPKFTLADPLSRCRLDYAKLGEDAGAVGAAALAFQKTRHVPRSRS
jgi:predicted NBD/HSP70 family sugar kinase